MSRQKRRKLKEAKAKEELSPLKKTLGVICAMSSCIFFAFSSLFVKLLQELPPQEVVFFRSVLQIVFILPPMIYSEVPVLGDKSNLPFLCVRGISGTLALCCQFYAFQHLHLADATVVLFSSPIFTGLLAHFLLGEPWGMFDAFAALLCFMGVVLIARPTFLFPRAMEQANESTDLEQIIASMVALCGAVLTSIALIAIRKLKGVSFMVPVLYVGLVSVVLTTGAILASGTFQSVTCGYSHEWFLLGLGLCGVGGQMLLTRSLQLERAGVVALVRTLDIALAFMLQLLFLDYSADSYSIAGAVLVIGWNVLVILNRGWYTSNKETEERRRGKNDDEKQSLLEALKKQLPEKMTTKKYGLQ